MTTGMDRFSFSLEMRDVIKRIVGEVIDAVRPKYRYARVVSIDRLAGKCTVIYNGETGQVLVNMGSVQPAMVNQTVRVEGIGTDKFIAAVKGPAFPITISRASLRLGVEGTTYEGNNVLHHMAITLPSPMGTTNFSVFASVHEFANGQGAGGGVYTVHETYPINETKFGVRWSHNWATPLAAHIDYLCVQNTS